MFTQHHLQLHNDRLELLQQNVTAKYWQLDIAVTLQLLLDQLLLGSKSHFMFLECVVHCGPLWTTGPSEYKSFSTYVPAAVAET